MKHLVLLAVLTLATCPALRSADPVLKADFASEGLPEGWKGLKGEWKVVDGALVGSEVATDKHAAVFSIPDPHVNSTLKMKVRLDGAKGFHLSYNHAKGHLFRLAITAGKATLSMDKDKKDPASKAETLASEAFAMDPGDWVEISCAVDGTSVKVTVGDAVLEGTHPNLAKEKTGYRFIVQGQSVAFDEVAFASSK
jgi:hypothetical protein